MKKGCMQRKRLLKSIFIIVLLLLLSACNEVDQRNNSSIEILNEKHPTTEQKYSIINTFDLYSSYFNKVKDDLEQEEIDKLYKKEVIDPVYDRCFADSEYLHMADFLLENAPSDKTGTSEVINNTDRKKLDDGIIESLIRSSDHLPTSEETTVCIFPTRDQDIPLMIAVGTGKIIVLYNDEYSEDLIKASIAHEYHHIVWTERNQKATQRATILDNLIFEGKAVMFEKMVYPDINEMPIDKAYILSFWEKIEDDLHKYDLNRTKEILRGDGILPDLYGYSEGYKMVEAYLDKHPNLTPEDWIDTETQVIFEEGEYLSKYK
ncbi:DUF2268 domain-containing putative Zn-dependent protease [Planococcus shixiaomingii]|uniref:DUF2268 domain-containing putative Zn-dependent protease n=1 Tax=Planococcus shixiaomingii TaxID=3058393 RepID=UPI00260F750A|nr:DUF2268 domain-containing putative Zn-dependent protease [Planococcus sp. N022]WKA56579.1 DUF2268 domain-containing putative Zn-dependent protease [Planococcus sp. N022]